MENNIFNEKNFNSDDPYSYICSSIGLLSGIFFNINIVVTTVLGLIVGIIINNIKKQ